MTKTPAELQYEIDDALRRKEWQAQLDREELARRARMAPRTGPTAEQLYNERAADLASGVLHGEKRGRSKDFRAPEAPEALAAKRLTKAQIAKFRTELRKAVRREQAYVGGLDAMKIRDFGRASDAAIKAAGLVGRVACQPSDDGVECWEKFNGDTDIDSGQIAQYHNEVERKDLCAYCGKPTRAGSMVLDEGQTAHRACFKEFEEK